MKIKPVQKNGRTQWKVDWTAAGKRQRCFFETEDEAKTFGESKRDEIKELGFQSQLLTAQDRAQLHAAKEILAPTGATIIEAARFFVAHNKALHPKQLGDAVKECIASKKGSNKRETYIKVLNRTLARFIRGRESVLCSDVTRENVEAWLSIGYKRKAVSKKSILTDVQTFFSFCQKRGWVSKNPCHDVEEIMIDREPPCIFTVGQAAAWMQAAEKHMPELTTHLALGLFAGLRPAEIGRLAWTDINLETGIVSVAIKSSKTRKRRIVHLSENCIAWLKGKTEITQFHFWHKTEALRGIVTDLKWGHDIMRHSWCSYHLALFENAAKTALEAGHSERILFANYRELVTKDAAKKFFSIMPS